MIAKCSNTSVIKWRYFLRALKITLLYKFKGIGSGEMASRFKSDLVRQNAAVVNAPIKYNDYFEKSRAVSTLNKRAYQWLA